MGKLAKCEGEVVVKDGTHSAIEFYEVDFVLDDAVKTLEQARSMIQGGLIAERLRREKPNYRRVRTCQVVSFGSTEDKPENGEMDKLLLRATQLDCLPENIDSYKRPDYKIKALQKAVERAEERLKKPEKSNVKDEGYID